MTMGVFDFKAIKRKLDCQEQKADFEEKNPKVEFGMYGYPSNLTVPFGSENTPMFPNGCAGFSSHECAALEQYSQDAWLAFYRS